MQEFVSFGLHVALIRQLAWLPRGYDLVPAGTVVTSAKLRSIMLSLEEANGPAVLVRLGRHLAAKEQAPILTMLRHVATPGMIADRWRRLEGYSHARGRSDYQVTGKSMTFHRGVVRGQPPARVENLLLHGFLIGLLEAVGADFTLLGKVSNRFPPLIRLWPICPERRLLFRHSALLSSSSVPFLSRTSGEAGRLTMWRLPLIRLVGRCSVVCNMPTVVFPICCVLFGCAKHVVFCAGRHYPLVKSAFGADLPTMRIFHVISEGWPACHRRSIAKQATGMQG